MMSRAFLGVLGLLAAPRAAEAQPADRIARIGYLSLDGQLPSAPERPSSKDYVTSVTSRVETSSSSTEMRG